MNGIFVFMLGLGMLVCIVNGDAGAVVDSMVAGASEAVALCVNIAGAYMLWMGFMRVGTEAGLIDSLARAVRKPLAALFPNSPDAVAPITLNLAANFFGMGNAATPFGLEAMKSMQEKNPQPMRATDDMVMFLSLNSAAIELLPTGILAIMTAAGATNAYSIVVPTFLASIVSFASAVFFCKLFEKCRPVKLGKGRDR